MRASSVGRGRPSERLVVYFKGLVGRAYRGSWSRAQREYFDTAAERLGHCNDYFLSFTNQPHLESAVKPLNRDYVLLIQYALGVGRREVLRSRENMVAHVLRHVFEDRGLRGFFFLHGTMMAQDMIGIIKGLMRMGRMAGRLSGI